jgi:hypothetical protein
MQLDRKLAANRSKGFDIGHDHSQKPAAAHLQLVSKEHVGKLAVLIEPTAPVSQKGLRGQ